MRKREDSPSLGRDLAVLADLYLTFLWMLRQRLHYGPGWQYHRRWTPAHPAAETAAGAAEPEPLSASRN